MSLGCLIFCSASYADQLVYKADFSKMPEQDAEQLRFCGFPEEFRVEAEEEMAPYFIKNTMYTSDANISLEMIQDTEGTIIDGGEAKASEVYEGHFQEKVYIVKQVVDGSYPPAIYSRVEFMIFGDVDAPKGLVVSTELLNHRYSAELSEGYMCGEIYYKRVW